MAAQGASPAKMKAAVSALRFFFKVTLGRVGFGDRLATVPSPERLPVVLSPEEVARLLGNGLTLSILREKAVIVLGPEGEQDRGDANLEKKRLGWYAPRSRLYRGRDDPCPRRSRSAHHHPRAAGG